MAIKAGRVGVAPDQVDEFGNINSEATSGYTKQEADAKFETQTHAASTYETKTDAATLQPKTLAVPIELLIGSALTVESALQGINDEVNNLAEISESAATSPLGTVDFNKIYKQGSVAEIDFQSTGVTAEAWAVIGKIPAGFRPKHTFRCYIYNTGNDTAVIGQIRSDGDIKTVSALSNATISLHENWYV